MTFTPPSSHGGGYPLALPGAVSPTRYVGGTATAAPATGTFAVGDYVITADAKVIVCTVAGSPGTWVQAGGGGGGGGLVLLEQHTAAASATLDFTTFISATYDEYLVEALSISPATAAANLLWRIGTGGGPTWDAGANYGFSGWRWSPVGSASAGASGGLTSVGLDGSGGLKNDASLPLSGSWKLTNLQSTTALKYIIGQCGFIDNAGVAVSAALSGFYNSIAAPATGVRFLMSAGNITSGTIRIYGIAKT